MSTPKKQISRRRTGNRRSHLLEQLTKAVNKRSPVKVLNRRQKKLAKMAVANWQSENAKVKTKIAKK